MPLGDSITDGLVVPGGNRIGLWQRFVANGYKVDFVGSLSNGPASLGDHDHEGLCPGRSAPPERLESPPLLVVLASGAVRIPAWASFL
jgi:hypothetical protein